MNMLDVHREALATVNEAHHLFLLRYRHDKKIVYGLVEGKDDPTFYKSIIERFIPEDWNVALILAGKKKNVIDVYGALDWNVFSKHRIAFFIDRDLSIFTDDLNVQAENIYVTDGYSIENSIVNDSVFYRLLVEAYNVVDATDAERDIIVSTFNHNLELFQNIMTPIMIQIVAWRKTGQKANLDNLNLAPLFEFDQGRLRVVDEFVDEDRRIDHLCSCVGAPKGARSDLEPLETAFQSIDGANKFIRGKYLLWLLSKSIVNIHDSICYFVSAYQKPPKIKSQIHPGNVMITAGPRARIPLSLKLFLEKTFLAHIASVSD